MRSWTYTAAYRYFRRLRRLLAFTGERLLPFLIIRLQMRCKSYLLREASQNNNIHPRAFTLFGIVHALFLKGRRHGWGKNIASRCHYRRLFHRLAWTGFYHVEPRRGTCATLSNL